MRTFSVKLAMPVLSGLVAFATLGLVQSASFAATVDITPDSMGSWAFDNRDGGGTVVTPTTGSLVNGPATPPLGTGSANLSLPANNAGAASELRTTGYAGTQLSSLSALSYSTYDTANNGQQFPYIALEINWTGGTTYDDRLFFEPPYQTPTTGNSTLPNQGSTALNTWQTWNALSGGWWANSGFGGSGGTHVDSLADYISLHPDATIINTDTGLGGVEFRVGFAEGTPAYDGNVDNFTIGIDSVDTTYNFEAVSATPLPAALPLFATGLGAMGLFGWRRKRKAAALTA